MRGPLPPCPVPQARVPGHQLFPTALYTSASLCPSFRRYNQEALGESVAETMLALLGRPSGAPPALQGLAFLPCIFCGASADGAATGWISGPAILAPAGRQYDAPRPRAATFGHAPPARQQPLTFRTFLTPPAAHPLLEARQLPQAEPEAEVEALIARLRRLHSL